MFGSVILGIDGSEAALKAAQVAAHLGLLTGSKVHAVSALESDPLSRLGLGLLSDEERGRLREAVRSRVLEPGLAALDNLSVEVDSREISEASPTQALVDAAERLSAGLIIVGRHGHGTLRDMVLGRVSARLLRKSRVPILTVPEPADDSLPERSPTKLLVPLDFSEASMEALELAKRIAKASSARLILYHATPVGDFLPLGTLEAMQSVEASLLQAHEALVEKQQARLEALREELASEGWDVTTAFSTEQAIRGMVEAIEGHEVDLVVMSSHGRSGLRKLWLGSVAEGVLRRSPVPVLVVPVGAED